MSDVETKLSKTFSINFRFEDPGDNVPHRRAQLLGTLLALALPGFELDQGGDVFAVFSGFDEGIDDA